RKQQIAIDEFIGHSTSLALLLGTLCFAIVFSFVMVTGSTHVLGVGSRYVVVASAAVPFMLLTAFMQSLLQGGQRFVHFNAVLLVQYATPTVCLVLALLVSRDRTLGAVTSWTVSSAVTAACAIYSVVPLTRLSLRLRRTT